MVLVKIVDIFWVLHRVFEFVELSPWRWRYYVSPNHQNKPPPRQTDHHWNRFLENPRIIQLFIKFTSFNLTLHNGICSVPQLASFLCPRNLGLLLILRFPGIHFHYFSVVSSEDHLAPSSFPVYGPKFCKQVSFPQSVLHVLSILLEPRSRSR